MSEENPTPPAAPAPAAPAAPEASKPGSETPPAKPAEDTTDWKTEARKWEGLAKADKDDAKAWRDYQESKRTDDEKREQREREREAELQSYKTKALKADVADDKKVPAEWRKFLTGSTKEELESSADDLLKLIAADTGRKPDPNQGKTAGEPTGDFLRDSLRH